MALGHMAKERSHHECDAGMATLRFHSNPCLNDIGVVVLVAQRNLIKLKHLLKLNSSPREMMEFHLTNCKYK